MRIYENTTPGIELGEDLALTIGHSRVEFEQSLLEMPGATFGNRLIIARAQPDVHSGESEDQMRFTLRGLTDEERRTDNEALVRITLPAVVAAQCTYAIEPKDSALARMLVWNSTVIQYLLSRDPILVSNRRTLNALVALKPSGQVSFREEFDRNERRSLQQFLTRQKPIVNHIVRVTVFSYDGKAVTREDQPEISQRLP